MPRWFYNWMGDRGWKRAAKKNGTSGRLYDKPFPAE
jgi:hypothetical protein